MSHSIGISDSGYLGSRALGNLSPLANEMRLSPIGNSHQLAKTALLRSHSVGLTDSRCIARPGLAVFLWLEYEVDIQLDDLRIESGRYPVWWDRVTPGSTLKRLVGDSRSDQDRLSGARLIPQSPGSLLL